MVAASPADRGDCLFRKGVSLMPILILLVPLLLLLAVFILGGVVMVTYLFVSLLVSAVRPHHRPAHR